MSEEYISRAEALKESKEILEQAERERLELVKEGGCFDSRILNDKREIESVWFAEDSYDSQFNSHKGFVISVYGEPGIHYYIPYIEVAKNAVVVARFPAYMAQIFYKEGN